MKHCEIHEQKEITDKLREECGVFRIYDFDGEDVASTIYYGLVCPAAPRTGELRYCSQRYERARRAKYSRHKGMGLVNEVFTAGDMEEAERRYRCRPRTVFHRRRKHTGKCPAAGAELRKGNPGTGPQRQSGQRAGAATMSWSIRERFSRPRLTPR